MRVFESEREAFDYLVSKIVDEAKRENVPLSDVERKMLYFSETDWTLPDIASVSSEFNRDYNDDEYEQKIAGLISRIRAYGCGHNLEEQETWDNAVLASAGDHYLQVMLELASSVDSGPPAALGFLPTFDAPAARPPHDRMKLWLTAFGTVFGLFGLIALLNGIFGPRFWTVADWVLADRNRFGLFVVIIVLTFVLTPKLRTLLRKRSDKE